MDIKKWFKNWTALDYLSAIVLVVCIFMIVMYFIYFNEKPSTDSKDWGSFGDYFASVTGLVAFLGVLYTARLSEKRAGDEKKESTARDERDQFFKMLELLRNQTENVIAHSVIPTEIYEGTLAFDHYKAEINLGLFRYIITYSIYNLDDEKYQLLIKSSKESRNNCKAFYLGLISSIISIDNLSYHLKKETYASVDKDSVRLDVVRDIITNYKTNAYLTLVQIPTIFHKREYIDDLYNTISIDISNQILYNAFTDVANDIFNKNGSRLDKFCNTFKSILEFVDNYSYNRDSYFGILVSQLSRDQLALLLLYSFSRFTNKTFVKILLDRKVFYYLDFTDLVLFNAPYYENRENLWKIISDLHQQYLDKH